MASPAMFIQVRLDPETYKAFRTVAELERRSLSAMARVILEQWLEQAAPWTKQKKGK